MSEKTFRFIVLTGAPGSGKTTLIKKVTSILKEKNYSIDGFFTEEVRSQRERTGFDVVLMNGNRAPLAKVKRDDDFTGPFVGKYAVEIKSFESSVLPVLNSHDPNSIIVLDEIGKMELLSQQFKQSVDKLINVGKSIVLATVPSKTVKPIPLVEKIKSHPETILITVNRENRNDLTDKIVNYVIDAKKKKSERTI